MTNWMTATGVALIAGGLATLIGFRRLLWSGGRPTRGRARRAAAARRRAIEAARRPQLAAVPAGDRRDPHDDEPAGLAAVGLADAVEPAGEPDTAEPAGEPDVAEPAGERDVAGVAEDEPDAAEVVAEQVEPVHRRLAQAVLARADEGRQSERFDLAAVTIAEPEFGTATRGFAGLTEYTQTGPREWWRDERASDPPTGDYWTPVPESAYADLDGPDDGWPVPSAVRSGRTLLDQSEPTAVVPVWPPARPYHRIELPRTWSSSEPRRRPRPRPIQPAEARSTVYVSKHAAEP